MQIEKLSSTILLEEMYLLPNNNKNEVAKIDNKLLIWFGLTFAESEFKTVKIQKYYSAVATGIYPCKQIELENFHPKSFN